MVNNQQYYGKMANQRTSWEPLAPGAYMLYATTSAEVPHKKLLLGRVLENMKTDSLIVTQPYRAKWRGAFLVFKPLFLNRHGYTEEVGEPAKEAIPYSMIRFQADLKANGELSHGTEAKLRKGSWGLFLEESECLSLMQDAQLSSHQQ